MVGDAQIGKTSLMVKYVEGTFDEEYIQTLGKDLSAFMIPRAIKLSIAYRCKFYGEDSQY